MTTAMKRTLLIVGAGVVWILFTSYMAANAQPDTKGGIMPNQSADQTSPKVFILSNGQRCFVVPSGVVFCTDKYGNYRPSDGFAVMPQPDTNPQ